MSLLRELHKRTLQNQKVTVWCTVEKAVLGPYFFENYDGNAVSLNSQSYVEMINNLDKLNYEENVFISNKYCFSRMGRRPTQPDHQSTLFALIETLWPLQSLDCPNVIISCWKISRKVRMNISPVHLGIRSKLFVWKSLKSTETDWKEWRSTSKTTFRNTSMKSDTTRVVLIPQLILLNANSIWRLWCQ